MKLYELQDTSIDDELKKTASSIPSKTDSPPGLNPDGMEGEDSMQEQPGLAGEPPMGAGADMGMGGGGAPMGGGMGMGGPTNQPEAPMQEPEDEEQEKLATKKVDDALYSQVKDLPFATDYDHEKTKVGPYEILQMDNSDLAETRNIVRNKINRLTYVDRYGTYDDPNMRYLEDMLNYVEKVIQTKNQISKKSRMGIEPEKG